MHCPLSSDSYWTSVSEGTEIRCWSWPEHIAYMRMIFESVASFDLLELRKSSLKGIRIFPFLVRHVGKIFNNFNFYVGATYEIGLWFIVFCESNLLYSFRKSWQQWVCMISEPYNLLFLLRVWFVEATW